MLINTHHTKSINKAQFTSSNTHTYSRDYREPLTLGLADGAEFSLVCGIESHAGHWLQIVTVLPRGSPRTTAAGAEEGVVPHSAVLKVGVV